MDTPDAEFASDASRTRRDMGVSDGAISSFDAGTDEHDAFAGAVDASESVDAVVRFDATSSVDASLLDDAASTSDAAGPDAAGPDAAGPDAAAYDAFAPDAGAYDASAPDATTLVDGSSTSMDATASVRDASIVSPLDAGPACTTACAWSDELVDPSLGAGSSQSLALGPDERLHISYFDAANTALKYAYFDGAVWHVETVDNVGAVGEFNAIAVDALGQPHISYYDADNTALKYAYFDGVSWLVETLDDDGAVGAHTSIALDSIGAPHISYLDTTNHHLKYAHKSVGAWSVQTADSVLNTGIYSSIAIDSADHPHIAYQEYRYGYSNLKYTHWTGEAWVSEIIADLLYTVGDRTTLVLDRLDQAHVTHDFPAGGRVMYTRWNGSEWVSEYAVFGSHASLALDATGVPHFSYLDHTDDNATLMLARRVAFPWSTQTAVMGNVGESSLAIAPSGALHIAYYDATNMQLRHTMLRSE